MMHMHMRNALRRTPLTEQTCLREISEMTCQPTLGTPADLQGKFQGTPQDARVGACGMPYARKQCARSPRQQNFRARQFALVAWIGQRFGGAPNRKASDGHAL